MFNCTVPVEILQIYRATSSNDSSLRSFHIVMNRLMRQAAERLKQLNDFLLKIDAAERLKQLKDFVVKMH